MSSYFDSKKIKVNLEFNGIKKYTQISPYKNIGCIKDVAKDLYKPLKKEIILIYKNKDISEYDNVIIADHFKKQTVINLKIEIKDEKNIKNNTIEKKKNNTIEKGKKEELMCPCQRAYINGYCRNCKKFICDFCRINKMHHKHKIIQIDRNDLVESVKLYAITLQSNIPKKMNEADDDFEKLENNKEIYNIENRYNDINEKLSHIYSIYNKKYMDILNTNNDNVNETINNYSSGSYDVNLELDDIVNEIIEKFIKQKKIMREEEFKYYFQLLSEKEKKIENIILPIIPYTLSNDIKEKINDMYDKIEKVLDLTLEAKNPIGLSSETFRIYNLILQNRNDEDEDEDEENKNEESEKNEEKKEENNEEKNEEENEEENENEEKEENNSLDEDENGKQLLKGIKNKRDLQDKERQNLMNEGILNKDPNKYIEKQEVEDKNIYSE